jgi:hypothetical protein
MPQVTDKLRAALANRLRSRVSRQFVKFVGVAVASLATSEIILFLLIGINFGGYKSGFIAAAAGAAVSYALSRRAWERTGRPSLLKETIPFWAISVGVWFVLALATKLGIHIADVNKAQGFDRRVIIGTVYLVANCVTFVTRFLIFHYVLFADSAKGSRGGVVGPSQAETIAPVTVPAPADD